MVCAEITAELGYWLGESYWGKGIMSEAIEQMVDYVFKNFPDLVKPWEAVFGHNKSSMRVLEKRVLNWRELGRKGRLKMD